MILPHPYSDLACTAYLVITTLILAAKDADSYLLKDKVDNNMTSRRVKRWHEDGVFLAIMFLLPCLAIGTWYWEICSALLIRLSLFDLCFNHWAGLPDTYLGGTATADKIFVKIFGVHGARIKCAVFFILLIVGQILILKL
jgi:hypothetical protein